MTWLDLGDVANVAVVRLNNQPCGIAWTVPWRVDVTDAITAGDNHLSVTVFGTWRNRLLRDRHLPENERHTWTTATMPSDDRPLARFGLLGPVSLLHQSLAAAAAAETVHDYQFDERKVPVCKIATSFTRASVGVGDNFACRRVPPSPISDEEMYAVFQELETPYKYGVLLEPGENEYFDCPNVFRHGDAWYMVFVKIRDLVGYETCLAKSNDLLHWQMEGTILPFRDTGWDRWQADGSIALVDPHWGGGATLESHDGKYWISYFGGAKQGYETDPLAIGMAYSPDPTNGQPWQRLESNPVLSPDDEDARPFEQATLYKSHIFRDPALTLGQPFVMFYNGKQQGKWIERIGIAVSDDMRRWQRYGEDCVIDNGKGISGDPQIIRMNDLWVMVYFGAGWKPAAFDTFACSRDLIHWRKWGGEHLIAPSEPWDKTFAHKPWLLKHNGVVYHFYCSVAGNKCTIALATSRDLRP